MRGTGRQQNDSRWRSTALGIRAVIQRPLLCFFTLLQPLGALEKEAQGFSGKTSAQ